MAQGAAIRAGKAFVELGVEDKLTRGLRAAQKKLHAFGSEVRRIGAGMVGLGATVAAPLAGAVKLFAGMGDTLAKMGQRTGISVEALSELAFAAEQSGADLQTLENGIRHMQRSLADAEKGAGGAADALAQLGLSAAQLRGLSPDEQFKIIADRLSRVPDGGKKAALAMQLLGRTGTALLPLMSDGAAGIEKLQQQARELGLTISNEDAQAAVHFGDTLDSLIKVLKRSAFAVGAALAPSLTELAEWLTVAARRTLEWIKNNRQLIVTAAKVAVGIVGAGAALFALGVAISGVAGVFGVLATIVSGVGAAMGVLGSIIAALVSPIGLVITAVTTLGAYLLYTTGAGNDALQWLGEAFRGLKDEAIAAFGAISSALAAGDIGLAAKILWLTLKLEWNKGIAALQSAWLSFRGFFVDVAHKALYGALAAFEIAWHGIEVAFIETTAFLSRIWTSFTAGFQKAWNTAVNWTSKRLIELMGLFDSSLDVDLAKKLADQQLESTNKGIDQQRDAALAQGETQRQQRRDDAKRTHDATLGEIGRQHDDASQRLRESSDAKRRESEDALAKARAEWEEAIAKASGATIPGSSAEKVPRTAPAGFPGVDDLEERLGRVMQRTVEVRGTFNAAAAQGLASGGGAAERTAVATEQTARSTRRIERQMQNNQATFA